MIGKAYAMLSECYYSPQLHTWGLVNGITKEIVSWQHNCCQPLPPPPVRFFLEEWLLNRLCWCWWCSNCVCNGTGWVLSGVRRGSNHRMLCGRGFFTLWGFNRLEAGLWIQNGYREHVVCGHPEIVVVDDERGSAGERLIWVSLQNIILLIFSR